MFTGRKNRERAWKRGQKSVTSRQLPWVSVRRVRSTAVLGSYHCSLLEKSSSSMAKRPASGPGWIRALKTGSPSKRGRQLQTMAPLASTSALMVQLPIMPSASEGGAAPGAAGAVAAGGVACSRVMLRSVEQ